MTPSQTVAPPKAPESTSSNNIPASATTAGRHHHEGPPPNISAREQKLSLAGGAGLALWGVARGKLSGLLLVGTGAALFYRGYKRHCHLYDALGVSTAEQGAGTAVPARQGARVDHSVVIQRPVEELYSRWRDLKNLPKLMRHLKRVEPLDNGRSRWTAEGPFGKQVEWEAEIITERENELIAWRSVEGSQMETAGSVHFKALPHDRGAAVRVELKYNPPGGKVTAALASLLGGGMEQQIVEDMQRFKSEMEAGEAPTVDGQSHGTR